MSGYFVIVSALADQFSRRVTLQVGHGLKAEKDIVFAGSRLQMVTVCTPNWALESLSFFRQLGLYLTVPERKDLMCDWNAIFDYRVGRGTCDLIACKSNLIVFLFEIDLLDRFRINRQGQQNTPTATLQRDKTPQTSARDMTQNNLIVRLQ